MKPSATRGGCKREEFFFPSIATLRTKSLVPRKSWSARVARIFRLPESPPREPRRLIKRAIAPPQADANNRLERKADKAFLFSPDHGLIACWYRSMCMSRKNRGDRMSGRKWQGTASGVLIGLGVGVGLGILLAPKSGKDTRDQIAGSVKDGVDGAIARGQQITRRAQRTIDDARELVKDAAEAGEQAYRDAKTTAS